MGASGLFRFGGAINVSAGTPNNTGNTGANGDTGSGGASGSGGAGGSSGSLPNGGSGASGGTGARGGTGGTGGKGGNGGTGGYGLPGVVKLQGSVVLVSGGTVTGSNGDGTNTYARTGKVTLVSNMASPPGVSTGNMIQGSTTNNAVLTADNSAFGGGANAPKIGEMLDNPAPNGLLQSSYWNKTTVDSLATPNAISLVQLTGSNSVFSGLDQIFIVNNTFFAWSGRITINGVEYNLPSIPIANTWTTTVATGVPVALTTRTITVTCGPNGTINPGTTQTVLYGSTLQFYISANPGFGRDIVAVDGSPVVPPPSTYSFNYITENHSISATFKDIQPPTAPNPGTDITVYLDASGNAHLTETDIQVMATGASDNVGIDWTETLNTVSQSSFNCSETGDIIPVTFTVKDLVGNSAINSTTANVTVADNIAPVARPISTPIEVNLSSPTLTGHDLDSGNSNDNCGIVTWLIDGQPSVTYTCSHVGTGQIEAVLTVIDEAGNSHSDSATVIVTDNIPPEALCVAPFDLELNTLGNASLTVADIDAGSSDNCDSSPTLGISRTSFTCADLGINIGPIPITLTVTDNVGGLQSTCLVDVTVVDKIAPQITLLGNNPDAITVSSVPSYTDPGSIVTDNCDSGLIANVTGIAEVNVETLGTYIVTYQVTDLSGNTTSVDRTVQVVPDEPPVITLIGDNPFTIECPQTYADPGATANDHEDGPLTPTLDDSEVQEGIPGTYAAYWSVTDSYGTTVTVSRTVLVADTTLPTFTIDEPLVIHECGQPYTDTGVTASDVCFGDLTSFIVPDIPVTQSTSVGDYTAIYSVKDGANNEATDSRTIRVVDTTVPIITLLGDPAVIHECGQSYTDAGAVVNDSCEGDLAGNLVVNNPVTPDSQPGLYSITYNAADGQGNAALQISRQVQVVDTTPPVINLNGSYSVVIFRDTPYEDPGAIIMESCDQGIQLVTGGDVVNPNAVGVYIITYDAQDINGNHAVQVTRRVEVIGLGGAPVIMEHPADQTVNFNETASFSVVVVGLGTLSYQWHRDGLPLTESSEFVGVNTRTLTINNTQNASEGLYHCIASNADGVTPSNSARLTVNDPAIISHPLSQALAIGQTASFAVGAVGSEPLTYRWYKTSPETPLSDSPSKITGATTQNLQILNAQETDENYYFCAVTGADGTFRSNTARLRVGDPVILTDPLSQTVPPGATVQFSVQVAGTPPLFYKWKKDGVGLTNGGRISGADTTTLTITDVRDSDEGNYSINVVGQNTAESNPATLRVGNVPIISNVIVSPASGNVPATGFLSMTVVMESGDTPFHYQWYLNGDSLSDDAHLSGSNGPTLSVISATIQDGGLYSVEVSNDVGSDTYGTIPITVGLFITHNLLDEIVEAGKPFSWSVQVSGGMGSIEYQWLKEDDAEKTLIPLSNGNGISGTDTDTLVFESIESTDEGYYAVSISDAYSSISTRTASLHVISQLPLGNGVILAAMTGVLAILGALFSRRYIHGECALWNKK